jgi:hypothetical protein
MDELIEKYQQKLQYTDTGFTRSLLEEIHWDARLIGIKGARGVGKTTLLLQYIKLKLKDQLQQSLYVSLDNIWFSNNTLSYLVDHFVKRGGKFLFLDEVHKYPNWSQELKNIYDDYPSLKVVFTGSSLLEILNARADLSRRAIVYHMQGLSFREYIGLETGHVFPKISLSTLLKKHIELAKEINVKIKPLQYFDQYIQNGYYPFYKEQPSLYSIRIEEVINLMLEIELPMLRKVDIAYIHKIKQLLLIIAESVPFIPNITKLSEKIGLQRGTLLSYLHYLDEIGLTKNLFKVAEGISKLQKPEKIFLENTNLMFTLSAENSNKGNIRETFFVNQLSYQHKVNYAEQGDFTIDMKYTFEVGGKNKKNKQIETVKNAFVVADDIEYGSFNKIPLWMFGFLY